MQGNSLQQLSRRHVFSITEIPNREGIHMPPWGGRCFLQQAGWGSQELKAWAFPALNNLWETTRWGGLFGKEPDGEVCLNQMGREGQERRELGFLLCTLVLFFFFRNECSHYMCSEMSMCLYMLCPPCMTACRSADKGFLIDSKLGRTLSLISLKMIFS